MDKVKDIEIDLRVQKSVYDALQLVRAGCEFPVVILAIDETGRPVAQGHGCRNAVEFTTALVAAYSESPCRKIRIVPVMEGTPDSHSHTHDGKTLH